MTKNTHILGQKEEPINKENTEISQKKDSQILLLQSKLTYLAIVWIALLKITYTFIEVCRQLHIHFWSNNIQCK